MGAIFSLIGLALASLVAVMLTRIVCLASSQAPAGSAVDVDRDGQELAERLAQAVRFGTVSHQDPGQVNAEAFVNLHRYLEGAFPRVHAMLTKEVISDHSLLYTWPGEEEHLKPILLLAHLDVVPAESGPEGGWTVPPFEGRIAEGYIWGRGTLDDKNAVLGILEAVEMLLQGGFQPRRTLYLAFGHDEEVGGRRGAVQIAAHLQARGVEPEYVLDEGLAVTVGIVPNVAKPVAMVGIAEKGVFSLELTVEGQGGHSMAPPAHTAIGLLSAAVHKLERNPLPARIAGPTRQLFATLAPEMPVAMRIVFANLWLFGGLVKRQIAAAPASNATIRTTAAVTIFQAGVKENVLPAKARAVANFRVLTGESIASVIEHVRRIIDDPRVNIELLPGLLSEPSAVSDSASPSFGILTQTIGQVFPEAVVAPGLVLGASDSRHYAGLSDCIYRFSPVRVGPEDLGRVHGTDERISVEDYGQAVRFYEQLIRNSDSM